MSKRLKELARRKQVLVDQCARERAELAALFEKFRSPLNVGGILLGIGALLGIGHALKGHPLIAGGISSLLVSGYGAKWIKQAGELLQLWRLVLPVRDWWARRRRAS